MTEEEEDITNQLRLMRCDLRDILREIKISSNRSEISSSEISAVLHRMADCLEERPPREED